MKKAFLTASLLISLFLTACSTMPDYMARLNNIRAQLLPQLNNQLAAVDLKPGAPVYLRVFKEEGEVEVWVRNDETVLYQPFKTYKICAENPTLGPKQEQGDMQSPEGFYDVTTERLWPGSQYHLAMNIGYPNEYDKFYNRTGDKLMIHGGCKSNGCFAMGDKQVEEIYLLTEQSLQAGNPRVPVDVFPFRMTDANMARYKNSHWLPFWQNLKQGYDMFEQNHFPPDAVARDGSYVFRPQAFIYAGI